MNKQAPLPLISVEGDPYNRGYQYGSQGKALIEKCLDVYHAFFKSKSNLQWNQALQLGKKFVPSIEKFDPEVLEEMRGIAEGAGRAFEEILALNVRSELTFPVVTANGGIAEGARKGLGGCTVLVATPEVTQSGHMLIAQNWDYLPASQKVSILLEKKKTGEPNCITLVEAGVVGKFGFNSAGMGYCGNGLFTDKVPVGEELVVHAGIPDQVIANKLLSAESLVDAITVATPDGRASSVNRVIASANGECISIETSPNDANYLFPEDGIMVHTNHFIVAIPNIKDYGPVTLPSTLTRQYRAHQLLARERGNITVEVMQNILRDHLGKPNSLCWHVDKRLEEAHQLQTNASFVMDITEKTLYIAKGPPCENEYVTLDLKDFL